MSVAAPLFLWISAAVALAVVALHLLAWRRPPESPLPTARFAPERPVRMVSRAVRPADMALLALRVLTIMFVGAALARLTFGPRRAGDGRVVVADRSRYAGPGSAVVDAARAAWRPGDALIVFDSVSREISAPALDSLRTTNASTAVGSLSPALVQAVRAGRRLARDRDSVEIVIVSPLAADELDAATAAIRGTWAGPLRLVRAGGAPNEPVALARPVVRASTNDPVAASLALLGEVSGGGNVRVARDAISAQDSSWTRDGHALVFWPADARGAGWQRRASPDTAFAVTVIGPSGLTMNPASRPATIVAPLERSLVAPSGRITARWSDGEAAVTEVTLGSGCIRSVAVPVPTAGDLPLTPAFRRFVARMVEPCINSLPWIAASDSLLAATLPAALRVGPAEATAALATGSTTPALTAWLLGLAFLAAVAELFVRRGEARATA
jgi:hypothetical protein